MNWYVKIASRCDFYIDLDETLIKSIEDNGETLVIKRPGVDDFLSDLKSLGKIFLCTASDQAYADNILKKLNIDVFDNKFYGEDLDNKVVNDNPNFLLIDNLEYTEDDIQRKMKMLGEKDDKIIEIKHVKVIPFEPELGQDHSGLSKALKDIKEKLGL